tara:strand:- start:54214 stop:54891 length:678 start_codon:yes stop_codon:yes gene_type:complete
MLRKNLFRLIFAIACTGIIIAGPFRALAQEEAETEWNIWTSFEIKKDITDRLSAFVAPQVRFAEQFEVDEYFIQAGVEYELFNFLDIAGNYRYLINERTNKSTEYFHRIAFDLVGKHDVKRLGLQLRTRYSNYDELDDNEGFNDATMRYRLKSDYDIQNSRFKPSIGVEFFHQLQDREINKIRYIAEVAYKIDKVHDISVSYLLHAYPNQDRRTNILTLDYQIDF